MANRQATQDEDEWTTVAEESATRIIFDTIGDQFTGTYLGTEEIPHPQTGELMRYLMFRGTQAEQKGELFSTSASWKLEDAFKAIEPGTKVRITYVKNVETSRGPNKMKDYRIDVAASR